MNVILVDENDNQIGIEEKIEAHKKGKLHRAFSIFVFNNKKELLLQKRSTKKYHSAGLWTNTCCSHPQPNSELKDEAKNRLKQEMGFDCDIKEIFSFIYKEKLENGLTEHEYDHVFIGYHADNPLPNPEEVSDWKWISVEKLKEDINKNPNKYTVWLKVSLEKVNHRISKF